MGGQIGVHIPAYSEICGTDPETAIALFFLKNQKRWREEKNRRKVLIEKLLYIGMVKRVKYWSEITTLSALLADKAEEKFDTSSEE